MKNNEVGYLTDAVSLLAMLEQLVEGMNRTAQDQHLNSLSLAGMRITLRQSREIVEQVRDLIEQRSHASNRVSVSNVSASNISGTQAGGQVIPSSQLNTSQVHPSSGMPSQVVAKGGGASLAGRIQMAPTTVASTGGTVQVGRTRELGAGVGGGTMSNKAEQSKAEDSPSGTS